MPNQEFNEQLSGFINAIGTIAEMTKVFFEQYKKCGFSVEQSYDMAKTLTLFELRSSRASGKQTEEE